jgi:8-oxo-dGTP diphosphatase
MQETRQRFVEMDLNAVVISAILERQHAGKTQVLIQTRWKPDRDPVYSGTLEIPAGGVHTYENVYEAVEREVLEETGLHVTRFTPDIRTRPYAPQDDDCFAFVPFCCQQQLKGGIPRIGLVFVCQVEDKTPTPRQKEVGAIQWMSKAEIRKIVEETPEKVFTLQLPALAYYLKVDSIE